MSENPAMSVNCPTCMKQVVWDTKNKYRPFCCERCKLIDLGDWATGRNAIAGEPVSTYDEASRPYDPENDYD